MISHRPEQIGQDLFEQERRTAEEQIAAAWQLHVESVQEQLERGWRDYLQQALEERFAAFREAFEQELQRRLAAQLEQELERAASGAIRALAERLNQVARRLRQASNAAEWAAALLDGAFSFAPRVVLFSIAGKRIQYEDHRAAAGFELPRRPEFPVPLSEAPAFQNVMESMDAVISMASAGELSAELCEALDGSAEKRICLLPVITGRGEGTRRVAAVLYVESGEAPVDLNLLEVITEMAGPALEALQASGAAQPARAPVIPILPAAPPPAALAAAPAADRQEAPDWSSLPREEQELHARAQRFARVRVAEIRLYHAKKVREGREIRNIYALLKEEMDRSRAQFRHEFMRVPSMIDYLHLEFLRTLANDDPAVLGPDYPGPLS
jgi:hypothetical protein